MKTICLYALLCAAAAGFSGGLAAQEQAQAASPAAEQKAQKTVLVFDTLEQDFGRIAESGGKVTREFGFVNTGDIPAVIIEASVSCKCTRVEFPKKPIAPGERGVITVTYDPKGQKGVFFKAIQVVSSTPDKRQVIWIRGEVYQSTPRLHGLQ